MKKRTLPLLLSMAIAPAAFSAIYLDGQNISSDVSITSANGNIYIKTSGSNPAPEPEDPTPTEPEPTDPTPPPVDTGSCGTENQDAVFETLNWAKQSGQVVLSMERNTTSSSKFTTTSSTAYAGTIALGAITGGGSVTRNVWISTCPGGPAVAQKYNGCNISSTEVALKWSQEAAPRLPTTCKLETNKVYYINYRNQNCGKASCDAFRNTYTNGKS